MDPKKFAAALGRQLKKADTTPPSPPSLRPRLAGEAPIKPPILRSEPPSTTPAKIN